MKSNLMRDFCRYIVLSVLGTLGVSCYILADTYFISKGMGADGLTALNLAIPVYNFTYGTGLMLGIGGATRFTVLMSQGREKDANSVYTNTCYLGVIFSVIFVIIGLLFSNCLASLFGAKEDVLKMTETYLKWLLIFAPAFIFNTIHLCFIRNDNSPRLAMTAMIIGSFSNIILDYIFIFPLNMGIFGAIIATCLSPLISLAIMSFHFIKKKNGFKLIKTKFKFHVAEKILSLGLPSLVSQLSAATVMIVFNYIILALNGNIGVAAYGVVANISIVVIAIFEGIAQGAQPLISGFYGQGNINKSKIVLKMSLITVAFISVITYILIFVFADDITSVFNSENNPILQSIAEFGLKAYFTSAVFAGINILISIFLTSTEKAFPAQILTVLRGFVIIIPMTFILSWQFQMTGVWLSFPVTELIVAVIGVAVYLKMSISAKASVA